MPQRKDAARKRSIRIAFVACDEGAAGRIRSGWPAAELERRGYRATASRLFPELGTADLLIVHRPLARDRLPMLRRHRANGAVVLVQEDDDLDTVPKLHIHGGGSISADIVERHDEAIRQADGLIVTTAELGRLYGPDARRLWRVDNYLPEWIAGVRYGGRRDVCRIGWAGITTTHLVDLRWIRPAMPRALAGAWFTTVGDTSTPAKIGVPDQRFDVRPYEYSEHGFYRAMSRADIGIVPLDPRETFNRSKSWLKALEYSMLGVPVVATAIGDQIEFVKHGKTGFLAETPEQFADRVQELVHDPELRARMGAAAKAHALRYTLERNGHRWAKVIEQAIGGDHHGTTRAGAEADGDEDSGAVEAEPRKHSRAEAAHGAGAAAGRALA
jgi:glycosyltransferase involved in cell wall biosynthesis